MITITLKYLPVLFAFIFLMACKQETNLPVKVEMKKNSHQQYRLFVDGKEFFVKGAGCEGGNLALLAKHGANSFRTWMDQEGHPSYQSVLDSAQQYGLKVLMGLPIGRERHGYDYNNEQWVKQQFDSTIAIVEKYKAHPALLGWIIGNELNLGANNLKIYDAVNDISKMIHKIDGNHPTTTTVAGIGKREADYIKTNCTDIDFLSIQMYGDIVNLQKRITDAGWDGPYMVTEWGATGHWETGSTKWTAPIEQNSREKAEAFIERYNKAILSDPVNCMGSYVFLWGQKQERTPTWYGMFLENGHATETVDAMHFLWNEKWDDKACPTLDSLLLDSKNSFDNIELKAGESCSAKVWYNALASDSVRIRWEVLPESTDLGWGGDFESRPDTWLHQEAGNEIMFTAPVDTGAYRLFVYIENQHNKAATANVPFWVTK